MRVEDAYFVFSKFRLNCFDNRSEFTEISDSTFFAPGPSPPSVNSTGFLESTDKKNEKKSAFAVLVMVQTHTWR